MFRGRTNQPLEPVREWLSDWRPFDSVEVVEAFQGIKDVDASHPRRA